MMRALPLALALACSARISSVSNKACPCVEPYVCSAKTGRCVPFTLEAPVGTVRIAEGATGFVTPTLVARGEGVRVTMVSLSSGIEVVSKEVHADQSGPLSLAVRIREDAAYGLGSVVVRAESGSTMEEIRAVIDVVGAPGSLDRSFGTLGVVEAPWEGGLHKPYALHAAHDGGVRVVGNAFGTFPSLFELTPRGDLLSPPTRLPKAGLVRFRSDGSFVHLLAETPSSLAVRSFDGHGNPIENVSVALGPLVLLDLVCGADGGLSVLAKEEPLSTTFLVARVLPSGRLNATFGSNGVLRVASDPTTVPHRGRLVERASGDLVLWLIQDAGVNGFTRKIVNATSGGQIQPEYAKELASVSTPSGEFVGLHATGDGTILASAERLYRVDPSGAVDPGFADPKKDPLPKKTSEWTELQSDEFGRILVSGAILGTPLWRGLSDGSPDDSFGVGGRLPLPPNGGSALAMTVQKDGRILLLVSQSIDSKERVRLLRVWP